MAPPQRTAADSRPDEPAASKRSSSGNGNGHANGNGNGHTNGNGNGHGNGRGNGYARKASTLALADLPELMVEPPVVAAEQSPSAQAEPAEPAAPAPGPSVHVVTSDERVPSSTWIADPIPAVPRRSTPSTS